MKGVRLDIKHENIQSILFSLFEKVDTIFMTHQTTTGGEKFRPTFFCLQVNYDMNHLQMVNVTSPHYHGYFPYGRSHAVSLANMLQDAWSNIPTYWVG